MTTANAPALSTPPHSTSSVRHPPRPRYSPRHVPLATVEPTEHQQQHAGKVNITCPSCGKVYAAGAIVTSAPEYVRNYRLANYTGHMVTRRLFCDHEDMIIRWDQACDRSGTQMGEEIGTYSIVRDRALIASFLRLHPQAAGVAQ